MSVLMRSRPNLLAAARKTHWDVVIAGGGITGAGILQLCSQLGLKTLLLEKHDFAWGTSSKSSKMVHGGLRYLASGDFHLAHDAVKERQRLLKTQAGLVDPLPFVMGHYEHEFPPGWAFNALLWIYDGMAGRVLHRHHDPVDIEYWAPGMRTEGLKSFTRFHDAVTDDARLTLNVIRDSVCEHALALHYCAVARVLRHPDGSCQGARCRDEVTGEEFDVSARVVINASGAWTGQLRQQVQSIRPLRGSHLVFPRWRVPVALSVSYLHPQDQRPVFVFPWEGVTVAGTTDLDHELSDEDAAITSAEVDYLLAGLNHILPNASLTRQDVLSTWSGVRPVVASGKGIDPSRERREHTIWNDQGLISVAGGKLTTFRLIAADVMREAAKGLGMDPRRVDQILSQSSKPVSEAGFMTSAMRRWQARYGEKAAQWLASQPVQRLGSTPYTRAELGWILRHEPVQHLDDLLLRRTRLGNILERGGQSLLPALRAEVQDVLGWSDLQWEEECTRYGDIIRRYFSLPEGRV